MGNLLKNISKFSTLQHKKVPLCFSFFFSKRNLLDILKKHKNFEPHLA
jgi:hypothetical protein